MSAIYFRQTDLTVPYFPNETIR